MRPPHTLLIIGCGDIGLRVLRLLPASLRAVALSSTPARHGLLREHGAVPLAGNLDDARTLGRLGGVADAVLHLAPPPPEGRTDPRTRALIQALARGGRVRTLVYASTSGVYGDCQGARFDETRTPRPENDRAWRRLDAEAQLRHFGRRSGVRVTVLRIPGIYAADRAGGHPQERLLRGTPVLRAEDDVYTNHIHADDLARTCVAALWRGRPQRVVHASDDSRLQMGEYFDLAADLCGLPRPTRVSRAEAAQRLSPMLMSFMSESRQLINDRLKQDLRLRLRYADVALGLTAGLPTQLPRVAA